jgi:hypothetical protein
MNILLSQTATWRLKPFIDSGGAAHWLVHRLIEEGVDEGHQFGGGDGLYPEDDVKACILCFDVGQATQNEHWNYGQAPAKKIDKLRAIYVRHPMVGDDQPDRVEELFVLKHLQGLTCALGHRDRSSGKGKDRLTRRSLDGVIVN